MFSENAEHHDWSVVLSVHGGMPRPSLAFVVIREKPFRFWIDECYLLAFLYLPDSTLKPLLGHDHMFLVWPRSILTKVFWEEW